MSGMLRWIDGKPYTRTLVPGGRLYWEVQRKIGGVQYRYWDPGKSKLAAFLVLGGGTFPFDRNARVLYLGAASGTTVSHISDLCPDGRIFAVEMARNPFRELLAVAEIRGNIVPILEDANRPRAYASLVGRVDIMYQDISQRNQTEIFIANSGMLRPGGTGYLMVKARCVDVSSPPARVFGACAAELEDAGFRVLENLRLDPLQKDHAAIVVEKP